MVSSDASNVEQYLRELPPERRREIEAVRAVIRKNLPPGYIESMEYGMIGYAIPLARFPDTFNGKPLCYASLAAQKNHNALYLMGCYMDAALDRVLRSGAQREGKKLDMGKSCVRFEAAAELPLRTIGAVIASTPVVRMIELHDAVHAKKPRKAAKRAAPRKRTPPRPSPAAQGRGKGLAARKAAKKASKPRVAAESRPAPLRDRRAAAAATRARSRRMR
jgi:hypothetical protein